MAVSPHTSTGRNRTPGVLDAIHLRRSIRAYTDEEIGPLTLERVLEAARLAPSAANRQERRFVVVSSASQRAALARACAGQEFVAQAPMVIVGCAEVSRYKDGADQDSHLLDVAIAMTQMALQATGEKLGTCWVTGFSEQEIRDVLQAPDNIRIVALLTMGHASGEPHAFSRLPLDRIVHWEKW